MLARKYRQLLFGCIIGCLLVPVGYLHAQAELISQAIADYNAAMELPDRNERLQRFARAEQLFRQAIDQQRSRKQAPKADLLVNLGNSALQAEHIGEAIVAFRQALLSEPGHQRAMQNLDFARGLLPESLRAEQTVPLVDTLFFWKALINPSQLRLMTGLCFFAACGLLAIGLVASAVWLRGGACLLGLVWVVLWSSLHWNPNRSASEAVVKVDEAWLYSADSENSSLRLADPLPDGTEVQILEDRPRWTEVRVAGRTGWVRSSTLQRVSAAVGGD